MNLRGTRWSERDHRFEDRVIEVVNDVEDYDSAYVDVLTVENPHSPTAVGRVRKRAIHVNTLVRRWRRRTDLEEAGR